jgi:general secretion pathway protein E
MSAHDLERLKQILLLAQGAIFFTGPSSSGKSTSIYAALRFLLANSSLPPNIATLEDPVEQELDGVNQTQIDPVGGLTFAIGLRTLLRMDPNVIVVGEVRDEETAQTAVQAGLSGHLVISTIHSGTAAQVFARLLHMRIEPFLLSSSVAAVVAQRLVRRLCVACRRERAVSAAEARRCFGEVAPPDRVFSAGGGCPQCNGTGHSGRAALFELAIPDDAMREGLLENASTAQLQKLAVSAGMTPLRHAAAEAVCSGRVSLEEIARALG